MKFEFPAILCLALLPHILNTDQQIGQDGHIWPPICDMLHSLPKAVAQFATQITHNDRRRSAHPGITENQDLVFINIIGNKIDGFAQLPGRNRLHVNDGHFVV